MGFQLSWCVRALAENDDDVEGAISWLLSNPESGVEAEGEPEAPSPAAAPDAAPEQRKGSLPEIPASSGNTDDFLDDCYHLASDGTPVEPSQKEARVKALRAFWEDEVIPVHMDRCCRCCATEHIP